MFDNVAQLVMDQADGDGVVRAIGMVSSEGEEVAFLGAHSPGALGPHDVSVACAGGAEEWLAQVERAMCNTVREGTWAQAHRHVWGLVSIQRCDTWSANAQVWTTASSSIKPATSFGVRT